MADSKSVIFEYTCQYYDLLVEEAGEEEVHGVKILVFRGSVVQIFRSMLISQSYYSKIRKALIDMGCITLLRKGGRSSDSMVALHRAPTAADWEALADGPLTPQLDLAILGQRVDDVTKSLGGLDIKTAIAELVLRVENLEREVRRIGRTPTAKRKS